MTESEKRELGGLARSIEALFSQGHAAPALDDPNDGPPTLPSEESALPGSDVVSAPLAPGFDPDPFETLDSSSVVDELEVTDALPEPEPIPDDAPGADSDSLGLESLEVVQPQGDVEAADVGLEPEVIEDAESPLGMAEEVDAEPEPLPTLAPEADGDDLVPGVVATEAPSPGPPPSVLVAAVDAFLAGHRGAGAEVESIAAEMRDRLALDPLADATERLVLAADDDPDDPALDMAKKLANPAVASRLVQRMVREEDEKRRADYVVLAQRLGLVMANAFKGALTDKTDERTRRACHDGLIAMGDTSRLVIEAMVEDENRFLVQSGVAILGDMGGEGAVGLVTSALANTDFRVRREALHSLAKLGGEESHQLVLASLADQNARVRAGAAEAAGKLGIERALRHILALLDDESVGDEDRETVQVQALRGLGHLGDAGAVQAIEKRAVGSLFSKPSTEVRVAAYQALAEIGTPHARQLLEKACDDKDPVVRTTARGLVSE